MERKAKPSFKEAVLVLTVIVLSIAIGVVGLKLSPNITILAAIGMVMLYAVVKLSLIHISEPTRRTPISYAVFCLKKKKRHNQKSTSCVQSITHKTEGTH